MWIRCDIWIQMEKARSIFSVLKIYMKEMSVFQMDVFEFWKTLNLAFWTEVTSVQNKCKWLYTHKGNNF